MVGTREDQTSVHSVTDLGRKTPVSRTVVGVEVKVESGPEDVSVTEENRESDPLLSRGRNDQDPVTW